MFEKVEKIIHAINKRVMRVNSELCDLRCEVRDNRQRPMYGSEYPFEGLIPEEDTDFL